MLSPEPTWDSVRAVLPARSAVLVLPFLGVLVGAHPSQTPTADAGDVRIFCAPRPGAKLTKTFDLKLELQLQDTEEWSARREGVYLDMLPWPGGFERVVRIEERRVVLTDEYLNLGPDRPLELRRTFEQLDVDVSQGVSCPGQAACSRWGRSPLLGETVRFAWDAEREALRPAFEEGNRADTTLLKGLTEDTDLRAFLGPRSVEARDSWRVDASALASLLRPGGAIAFHEWGNSDWTMDFDHPLELRLANNLEGAVTVEFRGLQGASDGTRYARLDIAGEVRSQARAATPGTVMTGWLWFDLQAKEARRAVLELRVEGTLLWDVENHHLHSLDLKAEVHRQDVRELSTLDGDPLRETHLEWKGELKIRVRVEC